MYTRKPLSGHVCVCVCVCEREREKRCGQPARAPLPGGWLLAFLRPPSFPGLWVRTRQPGPALPTSSVCPGGLVTVARAGVWPALAPRRGLVAAAPELVQCSVEMVQQVTGFWAGAQPPLYPPPALHLLLESA